MVSEFFPDLSWTGPMQEAKALLQNTIPSILAQTTSELLSIESCLRTNKVTSPATVFSDDFSHYLAWRPVGSFDNWRLVYSTYRINKWPNPHGRSFQEIDEVLAADAPLFHRVRALRLAPHLLVEIVDRANEAKPDLETENVLRTDLGLRRE